MRNIVLFVVASLFVGSFAFGTSAEERLRERMRVATELAKSKSETEKREIEERISDLYKAIEDESLCETDRVSAVRELAQLLGVYRSRFVRDGRKLTLEEKEKISALVKAHRSRMAAVFHEQIQRDIREIDAVTDALKWLGKGVMGVGFGQFVN